MPRRVASLTSQVDTFVGDHGGDRPIHRCAQRRAALHLWARGARWSPGGRQRTAIWAAPLPFWAASTLLACLFEAENRFLSCWEQHSDHKCSRRLLC